MLSLRRACRIFLLITANIVFLVPGLMIASVFFIGKGRQMRLRACGTMLWAKTLSRVLGLHIHCSGKYPPEQGLFIASNHCSYTDILVIGSVIPSVFVSKAEVKSWPLFGWLARIGGTVFVRRESYRSTLLAVSEAEKSLRSGANIVIFPEGTTDNGMQIDRFRSAFFQIPAEARIPVLPLSLYYSSVDGILTSQSPANEMAWHNMDLFKHFWNLLSKRKIEVKVHFNDIIPAAGMPDSRKVLAEAAYQRVYEGFVMLQKETNG